MKEIMSTCLKGKFRVFVEVMLPAFFLITLAPLLQNCGGGGDSSPPPPPQSGATPSQMEVRDLGSFSLATDSTVQLQAQVESAASFVLIADGGRTTADIDIDSVIDPGGRVFVTEDAQDLDPIGKNELQEFEDTLASGLFPHTPHYPIPGGTYKFRVGSFFAPSNVRVLAIINHRDNPAGGILDVNLIFCGIPDLNASNALSNPQFQVLFNEFRRIYALANIQVNIAALFDCAQADAARLTFLNDTGEVGELLSTSIGINNQALNFFWVFSFPSGWFGLISHRIEHAGEDFEAQVLFVA